ncbi:MAG: helix-turn-helix transcriptional regulator, partial [Raoultibacter sp.]
ASAIIAVVLVLGISSMYGWVQLAVVISLPLISGGCLYLALTHFDETKNPLPARDGTGATNAGTASDAAAHSAEATANTDVKDHITAGPLDALKLFGREGLAIFTACAIICFMGAISEATAPTTVFTLQVALAFSALLMGGVAFYSTLTARRINISFLFRWMCPLLAFGLACIVWFPGTPGIPIALSLAARFSFCLITQMYFARIGSHGVVSATQAFGLGWIFVHLGDLVGLTFSLWLTGVFPSAPLPLANICFGAVLLLIVVAMFVTNDSDNFSLHAGLPAAKAPTGPAQGEAKNDETRPRDAFDVRVHDMMSAHQLTPREREICMLLAQGRSIPYIRDALVISRDTVSTHVKHIYTKLDVHSRQELLDLVQR